MVQTLEDFEAQGYDFLLDWTMDEPRVPERIVLPSGGIVDINEIDAGLRNLKFGDVRQAELYGASEFFGMVMDLHVDRRCGRYSTSFVDEADVQRCREKYAA